MEATMWQEIRMSHTYRIVVADDEPIMRMYLEEVLTDLGQKVVAVAADGQELLNQYRAHRPDLVITDVRMPIMDGLRAIEAICGEEGPIPVVVITGFDERMRAMQTETDSVLLYLVKPVGQVDLERAIADVMRQYHHFRFLLEEEGDLRAAREGRRILERAKAILRTGNRMSDQDAFELIRSRAADDGTTLANASRAIFRERRGESWAGGLV